MNREGVVATLFVPNLTDRLEIRLAFDVANRPADFDDDNVGAGKPRRRPALTVVLSRSSHAGSPGWCRPGSLLGAHAE